MGCNSYTPPNRIKFVGFATLFNVLQTYEPAANEISLRSGVERPNDNPCP